jgi:DNA-binding NtrC family response regulator
VTGMGAILQIEHSPSLLSLRRSILEPLGFDVISVLGFSDALSHSLLRQPIGAIVIGHRASWTDRQKLISHFREALPRTPIVALLGMRDSEFTEADYNCPGDNPPLWIRTVAQAIAK